MGTATAPPDIALEAARSMADDVYHHEVGRLPRPRIFRIARLYAKPGREFEVMRRVEQVTRELREQYPDVRFRSYLARGYCDDGTCEVLAASISDRPEDMRKILTNLETAVQPFALVTLHRA